MAKRVDSSVLDAALITIRDGATRMTVCSSEPTNYASIATYRLAESTTTPSSFQITSGVGQGRRLTTALQPDVPITATGTAAHIALHNNSSVLYYVTTCSAQALTASGTVNVPPWTIDILGPT